MYYSLLFSNLFNDRDKRRLDNPCEFGNGFLREKSLYNTENTFDVKALINILYNVKKIPTPKMNLFAAEMYARTCEK